MPKTPHIGMSNATRCKNYRQRKKKAQLIAKDNIEKQLEQNINEKSEIKEESKEEIKGIKISSLEANSREPQRDLTAQFQHESKQQYNLFGELEGEHNKLDDVSYQKNLKNIFGNRAE